MAAVGQPQPETCPTPAPTWPQLAAPCELGVGLTWASSVLHIIHRAVRTGTQVWAHRNCWQHTFPPSADPNIAPLYGGWSMTLWVTETILILKKTGYHCTNKHGHISTWKKSIHTQWKSRNKSRPVKKALTEINPGTNKNDSLKLFDLKRKNGPWDATLHTTMNWVSNIHQMITRDGVQRLAIVTSR